MGKRKLTAEQRERGVLYQREYRALKRQDEDWRKKESDRTKRYYKGKKEKTASELKEYNRKYREKMRKRRAVEKRLQGDKSPPSKSGNGSGVRSSARLRGEKVREEPVAGPSGLKAAPKASPMRTRSREKHTPPKKRFVTHKGKERLSSKVAFLMMSSESD